MMGTVIYKGECIMKENRQAEIDLLDLCKNILQKWRVLLVCMLVFAIGMCGYSVTQNIQTNKAIDAENQLRKESEKESKNEKPDGKEKNATELVQNLQQLAATTSLTDAQIDNVRTAINVYQTLQAGAESLDTAYMLDYANENCTVLQYISKATATDVKADELNEAFLDTLQDYIEKGGLATDIMSDGYDMMSSSDITALISFEKGGNSDYTKVALDEESNSPLSMSTFAVTCKGENEKQAEELAEAVKKSIDKYVVAYDGWETITLSLQTQYNTQIADLSGVRDASSTASTVANLNSQFNTLTTNFTDEQKALLNAAVGKQVFDVEATINTEQKATDEVALTPHVSLMSGVLKHMVIGLFIGLFLPALWFALIYIFAGTIKQKDEFERAYQYYCLGDLRKVKENQKFGAKFDHWIAQLGEGSLDTYEHRMDLLLANIKATCKKAGIDTVYMNATYVLSEEERQELADVVARLEKDGIHAVFGGNALHDVSAFEKMTQYKNVIMVEKPTVTKYTELDKMDTLCAEHEVNVLGVVCC